MILECIQFISNVIFIIRNQLSYKSNMTAVGHIEKVIFFVSYTSNVSNVGDFGMHE